MKKVFLLISFICFTMLSSTQAKDRLIDAPLGINRAGDIHMVDYASVDGWDGSKICTWFPEQVKTTNAETKIIRLLVRGDDMGSFAAANQACLKAATKGIVRSIEVMTPCAWFPEAAKLLNENPSVDVGVHLILTSEWSACKWRPLTQSPSLTDEYGYFFPYIWPNKNEPKRSLQEAEWNLNEIEAEFRAQIEMAKKCIPHVSHISTHMVCAEWNKDITAMLKRLAKEYRLYWGEPQTKPFQKMNAGNSDPVEKRIAAFIEALDKLEPGNTYLFVEHPGYDTPEMQTVGHKGYENVAKDRDGVTKMFTDKRVIDFIKKKGIRLIGYNDVL